MAYDAARDIETFGASVCGSDDIPADDAGFRLWFLFGMAKE
jgi:hypothetical protein